jgi:hypothetical protein
MDLITLAPWAPWVLFGAALTVIILRLRRSRRSGARRDRSPGTGDDQQAAAQRERGDRSEAR